MRANARVAAVADGKGCTRLASLCSAPPLVLRDTPEALYVVGGAAGPLGGDNLTLDVDVAAGASLTLRTAAAAVALPGAQGEVSTLVVRARVGEGGTLRWLPEPSVAARGCRHEVDTRLTLTATSRVVWREELLLGRHGEEPGHWRARTVVDLDGRPLWRHELSAGPAVPGVNGPAVLDGRRAIGSLLLVDPAWTDGLPQPASLAGTAAVLPLVGPAVVVSALAGDAIALRRHLDEGWNAASPITG